MNEEELREYILKLEDEKNNLISEIETLKVCNEEHKQINEELQNNVKELKIKNYELFTQISQQTPPENKVEKNEVISINELTKKLIRGE